MGFCEGCPRRQIPGERSCGARGKKGSRLLIVGMSPGRNELIEGIPFVGPSGKILAAALAFGGEKLADCRIVNVINCHPGGRNETISEEQSLSCAGRLAEELSHPEIKAILCLGGEALKAVTGLHGPKHGISDWQGYVIKRPGMPPVIPAYHPSFVMRSGMKPYPWLRTAVSRAVRAAYGTLRIEDEPGRNAALPLRGIEALSFDIETRGYEGEIERIGFAWQKRSSPGYEEGAASHPFTFGMWEESKRLLSDPSSVKIAHNMNFDIPRLRKAGVEVAGPLHDTLWAAQILDPDAPGYSLNEIAAAYLDLERWKHEGNPGSRKADERKGVIGSAREAKEEVYNRKDAFFLLPIFALQKRELRRTGQEGAFQEVMGTLPTLIQMHLRGLRIDLGEQERQKSRMAARAAWASERWQRETGALLFGPAIGKKGQELKRIEQKSGVNPSSHPQVTQLLYETWGLSPQYKKEKGRKTEKFTADAEAVETLFTLHPEKKAALRSLLRVKHFPKFIETYLQCEERIFPTYAPSTKDDAEGGRFKVSAATGRIIAKGGNGTPPIQQLPKPLRKMILPSREGYVFVKADYASQELRVIAVHDPLLMSQIVSGVDFHALNAAKFGCDRTRAKNLFYGTVYGASTNALQRSLKQSGFEISQKECGEFIALMKATYPGIFAYHQEVMREARENYYIQAGDGRRRYFFDPDAAFNEIVNFRIQWAGAHMAWSSINALQEAAERYDGDLAILIHDEFVAEVPESAAPEFAGDLRRILERPFPKIAKDFWCPVEVSWGRSWGESRKMEGVRQ